MSMKSGGSLDYWRNYFRTANSDIFDIIDHAIAVAVSDCPKEFRLRRDGIAERLFSCRLTRCLGCDRVELAVYGDNVDDEDDDDDDGGCKSGSDRDVVELEAGASKESKVNSSRDDHGHEDMNMNTNMNRDSNYSYGEAEALTDEIEEESQYVAEVLRIRDILDNSEEESDSVLFESLRKLQLMEISVDCLKGTEIGKAVNPLRKNGSKEIRQLARTLINDWKAMVDEWVQATTAVATGSEGTTDSVDPSVVDEEEGLPSPPMDEGAFFAAQTAPIELSQFFDGMDDDGNPRQSGEFIKNPQNGRRPSLDCQTIAQSKMRDSNETNITAKDSKSQQAKKNEAAVRPNKPVTTDSGPGRPPKSSMQQKSNMEPKMQQKIQKSVIQRRPAVGQQDKFKCSDDAAVQVKLEATKRKLQERYQQAENAKRQRTIQVMELNDLPKQVVGGHRNPHFKPGNHNRNWTHARR